MTPTKKELTLTEKLNMETAKISWKELELFFAKGNLLKVSRQQDLVKVAEKVAANQQHEIESLILTRQIEFVTPEWVKKYCIDNPSLWAVVVAPYVLCQRT